MRRSNAAALAAFLLAGTGLAVPAHAQQHRGRPKSKAITKASAASKAHTPSQMSAERRGILRGLRASLNVKSHFKVGYLKVNGDWAYIRCNEVAFVHDVMKFTDLGVEALLERRKENGRRRWHVVQIWTLPGNEDHPRDKYFESLKKTQSERHVPKDIFPADAGIH